MSEIDRLRGEEKAESAKRKREEAAVAKAVREERERKRAKKLNDLKANGPAALEKLRAKSGDASKLTIPEMQSIALRYFGCDKELVGKKSDIVVTLTALIAKKPGFLGGAAVPSPQPELAETTDNV